MRRTHTNRMCAARERTRYYPSDSSPSFSLSFSSSFISSSSFVSSSSYIRCVKLTLLRAALFEQNNIFLQGDLTGRCGKPRKRYGDSVELVISAFFWGQCQEPGEHACDRGFVCGAVPGDGEFYLLGRVFSDSELVSPCGGEHGTACFANLERRFSVCTKKKFFNREHFGGIGFDCARHRCRDCGKPHLGTAFCGRNARTPHESRFRGVALDNSETQAIEPRINSQYSHSHVRWCIPSAHRRARRGSRGARQASFRYLQQPPPRARSG